jgi:predicted TPR repeat methyltransferase
VKAARRADNHDAVAESERLLEKGDTAKAVALLTRHIEREPRDARAYTTLARAAVEAAEPGWALDLLRAAEPLADTRLRHRISVLRADVFRRQNRDAPAMAAYEVVCRRKGQLEPRVVADAFYGLAQIRLKQSQKDEAVRLLETAIELAPGHRDARCIYAEQLCDRGDYELALKSLEAAIADGGGDGRIYNMVGIVLRRLGRAAEAIRAFKIAIELAPHDPSPAHHLGIVLFEQGRHEEAAKVFADTLARHRDDEVAAHMAVALSGGAAPSRASDGYVKETFDSFADSFEEKLVGKLGYRVPELIGEALAPHLPVTGTLDVLDLGCGTGLCGPILRPYARQLVGIDLSPKMLEKARLRNEYDELLIGEVTAYLRTRTAAFDLLVAADVLVYFGALEAVASAAHAALRPGGRLAFTVERNDDAASGWHLNANGRYAHSGPYLRALAATNGFSIETLDATVPRHEGGKPVEGYLAVLRRD